MDTDEGKPDATNPRVAGESETGCSERERFLLELEFVQVQHTAVGCRPENVILCQHRHQMPY